MNKREQLDQIKAVMESTQFNIDVLEGQIKTMPPTLDSGYWDLINARSRLFDSLHGLMLAEEKIKSIPDLIPKKITSIDLSNGYFAERTGEDTWHIDDRFGDPYGDMSEEELIEWAQMLGLRSTGYTMQE